MKQETFNIGEIPALLLGETSDKVFLFLHGKQGCKEEGILFANVVCPQGYQVLAIDLPRHGERKNGEAGFFPWVVVEELGGVMDHLQSRWKQIALRANSIGAYFALLRFETISSALLVSPILDMERLILDMMGWAGVGEEELEQLGEIATDFGETLSWDYLCYVRQHPIHRWGCPIRILYGGADTMTGRNTVDAFAAQSGATVTDLEQGEHWFHTPEQLEFLRAWEAKNC